MLIWTDGGLTTLCHICRFDYQSLGAGKRFLALATHEKVKFFFKPLLVTVLCFKHWTGYFEAGAIPKLNLYINNLWCLLFTKSGFRSVVRPSNEEVEWVGSQTIKLMIFLFRGLQLMSTLCVEGSPQIGLKS